MTKDRAVVVCTEYRGVFFGYLAPDEKPGDTVTLHNARMAVYWSAPTRGVLGLAATGPAEGSRVGHAVPSIGLRKVTCIMECSPEAVSAWEQGPWSK